MSGVAHASPLAMHGNNAMKNMPRAAALLSTIAAFTVVAAIAFYGSGHNRVVAPTATTAQAVR